AQRAFPAAAQPPRGHTARFAPCPPDRAPCPASSRGIPPCPAEPGGLRLRAYSAAMAIDVVLTGFEPFGGDETNPSWEAVRRAAPARGGGGVAGVVAVLAGGFSGAGGRQEARVRGQRRRRVLATGRATGGPGVAPGRGAITVRDGRIADNAGARPFDEPVGK